ncbi:zinc finger Y-chromosomal protein 2-like [Anthonomus grandis grandis]|uniref:zinc finger Y-chromosomal protein 2-like n=1 Tax=Anthonomus grandis grandis TaxID=2921223 RepID=UPI0021662347|nr:zinc finger Y-chromosomal protein 2-like [Anthonomus grandis grandis]
MALEDADACLQTDPFMQAIDALVELMDELSEKLDVDSGPPILTPQNEILYEKKNVLENLPPPTLNLEVNLDSSLQPENFKKLYVRLLKEELVPTKIIPLQHLEVKLKKEKIRPKELAVRLTRLGDKELSSLLKRSLTPKKKPVQQKIICKIPKNLLSEKSWHRLLKPKKPAKICFVCKKELEKDESINLHLYRYHPVQLKIRIRCPKCPFKTSSKGKFLRHMKRRHLNVYDNRPFFYCKFCKFKSKHHDVVKEHQRKKKCKHYKCKTCGFITTNSTTFKKHSDVHSDQQLRCPYCTYKGKNVLCLRSHMMVHKKQTLPCNICEKLIDIRFMATHVIKHSLSKKDMVLRCDKCDYRTLYTANYTRHLITHKKEKEKKFKKCSDCDYKTTDSGNLKRHYLYKHSPDFRWKCDLCEFATNHHNSWNHHKLRHKSYEERKKLKCPECSNVYLTHRGLQIHILNYHKREDEVQNYTCKYCGYSSRDKQCYKNHVRAKHESHLENNRKEVFYCLGCKFKAKSENLMEAHILKHQKRSEVCEYEIREK